MYLARDLYRNQTCEHFGIFIVIINGKNVYILMWNLRLMKSEIILLKILRYKYFKGFFL